MNDCKNVQELIVKAAMYDGITTTIRAKEMFDGYNVIEIEFSKRGNHSITLIDGNQIKYNRIPEEAILWNCKQALHDLFMAPYEEITCEERNNV